MKEELITIIVPVYNVQDYVKKCLLSICGQTYKNLEIIVVNDGSTDNSLAICQEIARDDQRIKILTKINGGLSSARNYGLDHASGELIAFVDSDDFVEPNMIDYLQSILLEQDADIAEVDFTITDLEDYAKKKRKPLFRIFSQEEALKEFFSGNAIENNVWNKLYKKSVIKNIKFKEGYLYEDFPFNFEALSNSRKVVVDTRVSCYNYYMRPTSIVNSKVSERTFDNVHIANEIFQIAPDSLKNYAEAKLIREKMKCVNRLDDVEEREFIIKREVLLKEIRQYPISKAVTCLSKKHLLTWLIMVVSPKFYSFLYIKFQKQ